MRITIFSLLTCLAVMLFTPGTMVAQNDMDSEGNNIVQLAGNNTDLSILVAALKAADLASTLEGDGPFTVFAPTDEAFRSLPEGVLQALLKAENREALVSILQYHVADGGMTAEDAMTAINGADNGEYMATTMNGDLTAMLSGDNVQLRGANGNTATVTQPDVKASNGVIHIIDAVLLPANVNVEMLLNGGMEEGMSEVEEGMDDMREEGEMAVNQAMGEGESMGREVESAANEVVEEGQETLEEGEMAVNQAMGEGQAMGEEMVEEGQEMAQDVSRSTQQMGNAVTDGESMDTNPRTSSDMTRRSGNTIVDVAVGNPDFKTLVTAIEAAELGDLLGGEQSEFTVFAPTNAAFDKLPSGTVSDLTQSSNKQKLQGILSYHVLPMKVTAADLMKALEANNGYYRLQTISGQSLIASTQDGNVILTDGDGNTATVTSTDVNADNGVIHVIDGVLMPKM